MASEQLPPDADDDDKKGRGKIVYDPQIRAMAIINDAIESLPDEKSRVRVLRFMLEKFEFPLSDLSKKE